MNSPPPGRSVVALVEREGLLDALPAYDPVVVGTLPLGLDRPGSAIDVVCFARDLERFLAAAEANFGDRPGFRSHLREAEDQGHAAVVRFEVDEVTVELFAQAVPTAQQRGYRHFEIERRLLELGGDRFADRVRRARKPGDSVEVAFAEVLALDGDPYRAILDLEAESEDRLRTRIDASYQRA